MANDGRKQDLVLANNSSVCVQDMTVGMIYVYLGAHKEALSTDWIYVVQDPETRAFVPARSEAEAIRTHVLARTGQYVILHNPAVDSTRTMVKGRNESIPLQNGKTVVIKGPCEFPLWPGQMAEVVDGHKLTEAEYIRIAVTGDVSPEDAEALRRLIREDWNKAGSDSGLDLMIGTEHLIRGRRTRFFIPPTGITVLKSTDEMTRTSDMYVMRGVSLEADEYVTLTNRAGRTSYVYGSTTVIPCEDQRFVMSSRNTPTFKAVSIDENSGVLLRTLVAMTRSEIQRRLGDVAIQFDPVTDVSEERDEPLAISRPASELPVFASRADGDESSDQEMGPDVPMVESVSSAGVPGEVLIDEGQKMPPGTHLVIWKEPRLVFPVDGIEIVRRFEAVHIHAGTARYVNNTLTGQTRIVKGECLYLPDPRCERFVVRRISSESLKLWFPGTSTEQYDPELVPCITIPQGTAAMVLQRSSDGRQNHRKVVIGYATYFLEWDETLCEMKLSGSRKGEPKDWKNPTRICYLWVQGNRVSDVLDDGRTSEDCEFRVDYTLTIDFEPDVRESWFNVDDYVFKACEEVRSRLRGGLLAMPIHLLASNYVSIIRDIVLGEKTESSQHRPGLEFPRFGARLVDIHVNSFQVIDPELREQLERLQRDAIQESVETRTAQIKLSGLQARLEIDRAESATNGETEKLRQAEQMRELQANLAKALAEMNQAKDLDAKRIEMEGAIFEKRSTMESAVQKATEAAAMTARQHEKALAEVSAQIAELTKTAGLLALEVEATRSTNQRNDEIARLTARADADAKLNTSLLPALTARLEGLSDAAVSKPLIEAFGQVANFRGIQVTELATQVLSAIPVLGVALSRMKNRNSDRQDR